MSMRCAGSPRLRGYGRIVTPEGLRDRIGAFPRRWGLVDALSFHLPTGFTACIALRPLLYWPRRNWIAKTKGAREWIVVCQRRWRRDFLCAEWFLFRAAGRSFFGLRYEGLGRTVETKDSRECIILFHQS